MLRCSALGPRGLRWLAARPGALAGPPAPPRDREVSGDLQLGLGRFGFVFVCFLFCFLNTPGGRRARRAASILVFARSEKFCLSRDVYGTKAREGPWPPHYFVWFFGPPGRKNAPEGCRARRAALCFSSPWAVKTPLGTTLSLSLSLSFFLSLFFRLGAAARARLRARASTESRAAKRFPTPSAQWIRGRKVGRFCSLSFFLFKHTIGTHQRRRAQHCSCSFCSSLLPLGFPLSTAR